MRRYLASWTGVLVLAALLGLPGGALGDNLTAGLRFAMGWSQRGNITIYSLQPRYGFYLLRPGGTALGNLGVSLVLEGTFSIADAPRGTGSEVGVAPLLRLSFPFSSLVTFFIEGGVGIILENIDSPAIPHTLNFTPQVGTGLDFKFMPRMTATAAYRFRHSSNASLYDDNPAFNVHVLQVGLNYQF